MKITKTIIWTFVALVVLAALYRIIPDRPLGFAPQFAIALFAGAVITNRKYAFAIPLLSMFISDALYQVLYMNGLTDIRGFYSGQWQNYLLIAAVTALGFLIKRITVVNVLGYSLLAPTVYYLISNFGVWAGQGGFKRPLTFDGLMMCYADGLPFYKGSLMATIAFSAVLFGSYFLLTRNSTKMASV